MDEDIADTFEDMALRQDKGRGGRGGRGGGRRRGGGGGGGGQSRQIAISRALSKLLRHQAVRAGIQLDKEGFAPLEQVLRWGPIRSLAPTVEEVRDLVRDNDKQRFTLKTVSEAGDGDGDLLIRANQGHSIKLDSEALLRPIVLPAGGDGEEKGEEIPAGAVPVPATVVHGTYAAYWPSIVASGGLKRMGRNHVHFSTGVPGEGKGGGEKEEEEEEGEAGASTTKKTADGGAVISGMRRDAELLVYVDVAHSIREGGLRWWLSDNGVVLTEGEGEGGLVPLRFVSLVAGRGALADKVGVLWKDGAEVAELPAGVRGRGPPRGKRGGGRSARGGRRGGDRGS